MPRVPQNASFSVPQHASRATRFGARATKAVVTVAGVAALTGLGGTLQVNRVRPLPEQVVLSMDLADTWISETADLSGRSLHLPKVIEALHYAGDDARVHGLVTCIGSSGTPGLAQVQELRNAISDFREAKEDTVPTVAFADSFDGGGNSGTRSYYLASAHDQVYAQPTGQLGFTGMSESTLFVSRLLQSLKIKADIFNREECKGMWRDLVNIGHSKAHRKAIQGLLTSLMSQIVAGVAKDRGLEACQVIAALDNAPLTVSDATMRGLLTGAKYRSDARQNIRHDRQEFSPRRISYVSPSQASTAESSDMTDSHGCSSCAQASSTLSSDSQQLQGLITVCAQAVKGNRANKKKLKAAHEVDSTEEFQRIAKAEEASLAPPGSAYVTSRFGDLHAQKTACHIISMQMYIKYMEHEKQQAMEQAGRGDIWDQPVVGVITAEGEIRRGSSKGQKQSVIACNDLCKQLQSAQACDAVKAVVLRLDSPGGCAVASDPIRHEVMRLKESGKPVVVSLGDCATSGGYHVSVAADRIIAQPGTITGSIGVAQGRIKIGRGLKDWGIDVDSVSVGKNAAAADDYTALTTEQHQNIDRHVDQTYAAFLEHVSAGRNMDIDKVRNLARGRVWSGQDAFQHGLVDSLGGLSDAITTAKELANLPQDEGAVNVHHLNSLYRPHPDSFQAMLDALRSENSSSTSWSLVLPALQAELMAYMSQRRAMSDICTPGAPWLATAVAGRLGSRATHGNTQVLAV
ncbi:TPA: hypothetical protein ACH3X2_009254 [Trebouxia sp. C0005]